MAGTDIRKFNFGDDWKRYPWKNADFLNLQNWIFQTIGGIAEGAFGASILTGLKVTIVSGMTVRVGPGIAENESGELLVNGGNVDVAITTPVGNPAKTRLVIRPLKTGTTNIPKPLIPTESADLHTIQGMEIVEIAGTPDPSPVYPAKATGDVGIIGFSLGSGQATMVLSSFDYAEQDRPSLHRKRVAKKAVDYTVQLTDDIIEMDCATGAKTMTLPDAKDGIGKEYLFTKIDSSSNAGTIARAGADTISGGTSFDLPDQWDFVRIYSDGISDWRIV